jgi:hypothetical protein
MQTQTQPQARTEGLVIRELPEEVLVYDLERHKAHCLNHTAAAVWRHCDGETEPREMGFRLAKEFGTPVDEDVVWLALDQLSSLRLLEQPVVRADGLSRAQLVKRAGLVAAAVVLPTAASLVAPTAAQAAVSCPTCGINCPGGSSDCVNCPVGCKTCANGTCSAP